MAERFLKLIFSKKCQPNRLPCNVAFDRLIDINEKAPMSSRGFGNTSDSAESKIRIPYDLILAQAPNSYKKKGA